MKDIPMVLELYLGGFWGDGLISCETSDLNNDSNPDIVAITNIMYSGGTTLKMTINTQRLEEEYISYLIIR